MKYDIKVGDYVETRNGRIGWVTNASISTFEMIFRGDSGEVVHSFPLYDTFLVYSKEFRRIGKYDFTTEESNNAIKPFEIDKNYHIYIGENNTKCGFQQIRERDKFEDAVIDKINEIIKYLNKKEGYYD